MPWIRIRHHQGWVRSHQDQITPRLRSDLRSRRLSVDKPRAYETGGLPPSRSGSPTPLYRNQHGRGVIHHVEGTKRLSIRREAPRAGQSKALFVDVCVCPEIHHRICVACGAASERTSTWTGKRVIDSIDGCVGPCWQGSPAAFMKASVVGDVVVFPPTATQP